MCPVATHKVYITLGANISGNWSRYGNNSTWSGSGNDPGYLDQHKIYLIRKLLLVSRGTPVTLMSPLSSDPFGTSTFYFLNISGTLKPRRQQVPSASKCVARGCVLSSTWNCSRGLWIIPTNQVMVSKSADEYFIGPLCYKKAEIRAICQHLWGSISKCVFSILTFPIFNTSRPQTWLLLEAWLQSKVKTTRITVGPRRYERGQANI